MVMCFFSTIQKLLVPHVMPFNGTNHHSVIVLDNASIHHVDGVIEMLHSLGTLVLFLPPYSPDFNPIEEAFSKVKSLIRDYELELETQSMNMQEIIMTAFSNISIEDCQQWISHWNLQYVSIMQCH